MGNWSGFFRESAGPGWALLGDAGHFKDPTPGQGIADALRQAERMAAAILRGRGEPAALDEGLRDWWAWRDRDAWEMYWFAQDIGSTRFAPIVARRIQMRLAADLELTRGFVRVLNHEVAPSKVFTPRVMAPLVGRAFLSGRGERRELVRQLREVAVEEFQRRGPPRVPAPLR
jgi:2-polyprenyl-6-methoxyphenol hydroxylase-like FAD-dependent oxidoreductase